MRLSVIFALSQHLLHSKLVKKQCMLSLSARCRHIWARVAHGQTRVANTPVKDIKFADKASPRKNPIGDWVSDVNQHCLFPLFLFSFKLNYTGKKQNKKPSTGN